MRIEIEGDGLPSLDEHDLRWNISDRIEELAIGEVIGSGGGCGEMDIGIEVADAEAAKLQMRAIAEEYGLKNVTFTE